jgi:hypothetical protein
MPARQHDRTSFCTVENRLENLVTFAACRACGQVTCVSATEYARSDQPDRRHKNCGKSQVSSNCKNTVTFDFQRSLGHFADEPQPRKQKR